MAFSRLFIVVLVVVVVGTFADVERSHEFRVKRGTNTTQSRGDTGDHAPAAEAVPGGQSQDPAVTTPSADGVPDPEQNEVTPGFGASDVPPKGEEGQVAESVVLDDKGTSEVEDGAEPSGAGGQHPAGAVTERLTRFLSLANCLIIVAAVTTSHI